MPRGRGEGGKPFACPLVLVAIFADGIFFVHVDFTARRIDLAAYTKRVLTATASMIYIFKNKLCG